MRAPWRTRSISELKVRYCFYPSSSYVRNIYQTISIQYSVIYCYVHISINKLLIITALTVTVYNCSSKFNWKFNSALLSHCLTFQTNLSVVAFQMLLSRDTQLVYAWCLAKGPIIILTCWQPRPTCPFWISYLFLSVSYYFLFSC